MRERLKAFPKVDIKTFGLYRLFKPPLHEDAESLHKVFGTSTAKRLLAFSPMRWAYHSPIKRIEHHHAHDMCPQDRSVEYIPNDKPIRHTLKEADERRGDVLSRLRFLPPESAAQTARFILPDSTHVMSCSEHLAINRSRYNNSCDFGKRLRPMYLFSAEPKRPVYYHFIQGNIPDANSMPAVHGENVRE